MVSIFTTVLEKINLDQEKRKKQHTWILNSKYKGHNFLSFTLIHLLKGWDEVV
jgi:hypothetical protein